MVNDTTYFVGVYTKDGNFFQLYSCKDKADAENKYKQLKEAKDSIVIDRVPREDFLALTLNAKTYKWGKLIETECLNRIKF